MNKNHTILFVAALGGLSILFWLSPFSEVEPAVVCHGMGGLIENPAGADIQPLCGYLLWGQGAPLFPFKIKATEKTDFCIANLKSVEEYCNVHIDQLLADEFIYSEYTVESFDCNYLIFDSGSRPKHIITIDWFSEEFRESDLGQLMGVSEIEISEWYSISSNTTESRCQDLEENIKIT